MDESQHRIGPMGDSENWMQIVRRDRLARFTEAEDQLEKGPLYCFSDWPTGDIPQIAAGVYTIWRGTEFVYVGMAGRGNAAKEEQAKLKGKPWGLYNRLESHASGGRSGDRFCIYICDRFVVPTLSRTELRQAGTGELNFDRRTREFIRTELAFRFMKTPDGEKALQLEDEVRRGALPAGKPTLNPLPK
jgi:hypothetical protein